MTAVPFKEKVLAAGSSPLRAGGVRVLQVNLGYRCNLSCKHCHVAGGPARTESMDAGTAAAVLRVLRENPLETLDLTGGAPELNPALPHAGRRGPARRAPRDRPHEPQRPARAGPGGHAGVPARPRGGGGRLPPLLPRGRGGPGAGVRHLREVHRRAAAAQRAGLRDRRDGSPAQPGLQPAGGVPRARAGGTGGGLPARAGGAPRHLVLPAVRLHQHADRAVPGLPAALRRPRPVPRAGSPAPSTRRRWRASCAGSS